MNETPARLTSREKSLQMKILRRSRDDADSKIDECISQLRQGPPSWATASQIPDWKDKIKRMLMWAAVEFRHCRDDMYDIDQELYTQTRIPTPLSHALGGQWEPETE